MLLVLLASAPASAQQRGGDVGGNPARRKVTRLPKLTTFVEAEYPEAEKARGRAAAVVLRITIDATGHVQDATIVESAGPDFDAATRFIPFFAYDASEMNRQFAPDVHTRPPASLWANVNAYPSPFTNRGVALVMLGRDDEALGSFRSEAART